MDNILKYTNVGGPPFFKNKKCSKLGIINLCRSVFQKGRKTIQLSNQNHMDFIAVEDV